MHRPTKHLRALLPFILLLAPLPAAAQAVMFRAARIYTMEQDSLVTSTPALAVQAGRIVAVGDSASVARVLGQRGLRYSVDRRFAANVIFPGFVEAHTHFQMYGMFAATPYVGYGSRPAPDGTLQPGVPTLAGVVSTLQAELAQHPGRPVFGYGTDPIYWNGSRLTASELNQVSSTVPVMVQLASGHIVVCNDTMLGLARNHDPALWNQLVASGRWCS
ncbi:amidohydrolase family protein [Longimicrobium sp.]|uniref:amidohydrolase family protein n=1 Tax=Longimicrobium sp. TaxID=2029185 RepID=UPI002BC27DC8|nr:amidohydrolase family protein [Longimicrobium sp.]HSU13029.1 amidohydrolase family protein [Longimicrobium sp.]